ncbi:hypothetical protein [Streptomyces cucumeris]|uniref:WD40 domain-containing protein n=1 Tax=Streptomyces cucumeris TaxID=2962890 RepID=UPI003D751D2A
MGRREKPIDPGAGPVQRFAFELRKLRQEAGSPTYRVMAREAEYSTAALARAAAGETLPSLPLTLAYVKACGAELADWERRWHAARSEEAAQSPASDEESADPPYRGLARFETSDHARFFGRTRLTDSLTAMAGARRCVMVLGPSGSGKSSLLRAGLVPRLQTTTDPALRPAAIRILTPGPRPVRDHRRLFTPAEGEGDTWLVVDQFEEVFTLCQDAAERREFIGLLLSARDPGSRLRVVVGARADFYARCLEYESLAAVLGEASLPVVPMTPDELREVIVKPAAAEGLIVERTLTARLIEEVGEEPGGLPLISHTLLETWRRRRGRTLTLEGYEATGGIHGAIAQTAEALYTQLTPPQAEAARRILLRLITPGEGTTPDTRRPTERAELITTDTGPDPDTVLQQLARARLLTLDDDSVDLAHEALITAWPRLHGWIEDNRERLRRHRRLTDAARNWHNRDRDTGALLRGTELTEAEDAFPSPEQQDALTALERDFLDQSTRAEHRRSRRARSLTVILATLLVLALIATGIAFYQQHTATTAQRAALTAQHAAQSRQLAAQSVNLQDSNPDLASLLAVKAWKTRHTAEAAGALYAAPAVPLRHRLTGPGGSVESLRFSTDGQTLAISSDDDTVRLWDVEKGKPRTTINTGAEVNEVAFSPDGKTLATINDDHTLRLRGMKSGKTRITIKGHSDDVVSMVFGPDGKTLATGSRDGTVCLWDVKTGKARTTLKDRHDRVVSMAFSPDRKTLATGGEEGAHLWDVETGKTRTTLKGHSDDVASVAFSPDGKTVATGSGDGTARLWDVGTGKARTTLTLPDPNIVYSVAFSPDGKTLATGNSDHTACLWDVETGKARTTLKGHDSSLYAVAFSPDGKTVATGSDDVRLWDVEAGKPRITFKGNDFLFSVALSPDGKSLATGSRGGTVRLWDAETGRTRATINTGAEVDEVAFSPDGKTLETDGGRLWDVETGKTRTTLTGHVDKVNSPAFSPDGKTHATVNDDGIIRLRNMKTGKIRRTINTNDGTAKSPAFSPDGKTLATGGDKGAHLWDVETGKIRIRLTDHADNVNSLAFSPDGKTLATANGDGTVRLWDVETGKTRTTLTGHAAAVQSVTFGADGKTLATAGWDYTARLWNIDLRGARDISRAVCASLDRDITNSEHYVYLRGQDPAPACPN